MLDLAANRPSRLPGFDVVRGLALIGVVVMNYHGYLNGGSGIDPSFAERVFDPWSGVLSTRFAATFVMVAGVGAVLLTNRSRISGDAAARQVDRWRLIRRGVVLLAFGYALDWIWQGTILFYYGALFIVAGLIFTFRIRWLLAIGAASIIGAAGVQVWAVQRQLHGHDTGWLFAGGRWGYTIQALRSPRDLVFDIWVNGTHPLLPWLGFFCCGMVLGRLIPHLDAWRRPLLVAGMALLTGGYALATVVERVVEDPSTDLQSQIRMLAQTDPFSRSPLYVVTTLGSSIVATVGIAWIGDRFPSAFAIDLLRRAGQMTLTLYVLHILVFNYVVTWRGWVQPTGLDTALVFAVLFWATAIAVGAWWNRFVGRGPLEVLYRRFGG